MNRCITTDDGNENTSNTHLFLFVLVKMRQGIAMVRRRLLAW